MSVPRKINCFNSDKKVSVDLGQSWKLFDNNKNMDTVIFYNGTECLSGSSRRKDNPRVDWVETDKGPFAIKSEDDIREASLLTGFSIDKIKSIIASNPLLTKVYLDS